MVSFFGLKIGGDKKKKNEKQGHQLKRDPNILGENQYFNPPISKPIVLNGPDAIPEAVPVPARPQTSHSSRSSRISKFFVRPYANNNAASSSMVDLSGPPREFHQRNPSSNSVRHGGSTFEMRHAWTDGSIPTRPGTSGGIGNSQSKPWVNPLDVHFAKEPAQKSPLAKFDFTPTTSNGASPTDGNMNGPMNELPRGAPSPPASIRSNTGESSVGKVRGNNPSTLRQVASLNPVAMGPSALPSPANSLGRSSEDRQAPIWTGPLIRNVTAKRDTMNSLTFDAPRRRSLSMDIEQAERSILAEFNFGNDGPGSAYPGLRHQPSDRSEFAAFNFSDDQPTSPSGGPMFNRPETPDFSGFNFADIDRPKTSAGPEAAKRIDRPAPLNIHKDPQRPDFQQRGPNSPALQSPTQPLSAPPGWTRPRPNSASDNRPKGDRILPGAGPAAAPAPIWPQFGPDEPEAEPEDELVGYFGSTGPRASPIDTSIPRLENRFPSRQSIRSPDDPERGYDPRLRVAPRTKPRSPSPLIEFGHKPLSPEPLSPPRAHPSPPKNQTFTMAEQRSPVDDMFQDKGELDLSFSFPGQPPLPSPRSIPGSGLTSPRTPNPEEDVNWPLVASPPTQPLPELPRPEIASESRPYTPPPLRLNMNTPRIEPPPRAPGRTTSPKMAPPMPPSKVRPDGGLDPGLRTPTGTADNFGTAFI